MLGAYYPGEIYAGESDICPVPGGFPIVRPEYSGTPRFVLAGTGQQILLRGVNTIQNSSTVDRQATLLSMGCNMVRVVTDWSRMALSAPTGSGTTFSTYVPVIDATALATLDSDLNYYAAHNIYFQLDFHQASWSPFFSGDGIPSWYYTDSRFTSQQNGGAGWTVGAQSTAINAWWTAETAMSQALYISYVTFMVKHVLAQPYAPWLMGYEVFNEPNPGGAGGTSASKAATMHTWLAPVVAAIHAIDPYRAKCLMIRGGGQGYGTATFSQFGDLKAQKCVLEYHNYYTGLAPGSGAVGGADVGYSVSGDEYVPDSNTVHNTTAGSTYHGAEVYQEAFLSVPIAKAAALGIPLFFGEQGVHPDDTGRLQYISDAQTAIDNLHLSSTVWKLGRYPTDNLGLMNSSGTLLDTGLAWQTWFQNTTFILGNTQQQRTDSATGTDVSLNRRIPVDSAHGTDVSIVHRGSNSDSATGTDASTLKPKLTRTETGTATDVSVVKVLLARTDTATSTDASKDIRARTDSATGVDVSSLKVTFPVRTETGTAVESIIVFGQSEFTVTDTGHGLEISLTRATYARTDSATGTDSSKVNQQKPTVDSATGTDARTLKVLLARIEQANGQDVSSLKTHPKTTEIGNATDLSSTSARFPQTDSAHGTDSSAVFLVHVVAVSDTAVGDDEAFFTQAIPLHDEILTVFETATPVRWMNTPTAPPPKKIGRANEFEYATPLRLVHS